MKYLAILLCICLLLGGCTAPAMPPETTEGTTEAPLYIIDPSAPPDSTPDPIPEIPTGTDSTAPAPEIGPEGLPTPTL